MIVYITVYLFQSIQHMRDSLAVFVPYLLHIAHTLLLLDLEQNVDPGTWMNFKMAAEMKSSK